MEDRKAVVIGISGCSSSGKTTLARLLRDIFPGTMILHEDDFYRTDAEIPVDNGFQDWDCLDALCLPDMEAALSHIRSTGTFPVGTCLPVSHTTSRTDHGCPSSSVSISESSSTNALAKSKSQQQQQPSLNSKEDQNSVGKCPVSDAKVDEMKATVAAWLAPGGAGNGILREGKLRLCLFDGFLLYAQEMRAVMDLIDVKVFLLVSRRKATQRREARDGYVTLEGFWKDPPGYVDKIVWPNYAASHAWLFEDGDVEGRLDRDRLEETGILAQLDRGLDIDMETTLEWAVELIMREVEKLATAD